MCLEWAVRSLAYPAGEGDLAALSDSQRVDDLPAEHGGSFLHAFLDEEVSFQRGLLALLDVFQAAGEVLNPQMMALILKNPHENQH